MFSTHNFKNIICPYDTSCKRLYCWFGHSKAASSYISGPKVKLSLDSKVPWKSRQLWATRLYEKLLATNEPEPSEIALKLEMDIHEKCDKGTYASSALATLKTIGNAIKPEPFKIKRFKPFLLNESELIGMGYPIFPIPQVSIDLYNVSRNCIRCSKPFNVTSELEENAKVACHYHPGRLRNTKDHGSRERTYWCCNQFQNQAGCTLGCHVYQFEDFKDLNAVNPFKQAPLVTENAYKILALDCEMVYTSGGLELARCTITNESKSVVYDEIIQPLHPIYDFNTKYSGITNLINSVSFIQFRATLFTLMDQNTILVGHSLESDLKAMRLVHTNVIDTVKLYPHVKGLPFRHSLKYLAAEHLQKIIQNDEAGHDSMEDAVISFELVLRLLKD
eukprot:NODE_257_length_12663_cov_0.723655.p3 type:complete len:391 gc:universal NODE_257_length_12663_cov_0.723655:9591-10763(+)